MKALTFLTWDRSAEDRISALSSSGLFVHAASASLSKDRSINSCFASLRVSRSFFTVAQVTAEGLRAACKATSPTVMRWASASKAAKACCAFTSRLTSAAKEAASWVRPCTSALCWLDGQPPWRAWAGCGLRALLAASSAWMRWTSATRSSVLHIDKSRERIGLLLRCRADGKGSIGLSVSSPRVLVCTDGGDAPDGPKLRICEKTKALMLRQVAASSLPAICS
mmetsp:Transcript_1117/g.2126  ORF Transcript_1117/g.2126 Transcript_1117/m.2126 type:complete len:224 (-) Transcript_1117:310-981(-)